MVEVEALVAAAARAVEDHQSVSAFLIQTAPEWRRIGEALSAPAEPGAYVRHILGRIDDVEVVLIKWGLRATTVPHGHPEGGCWLSTLEGKLMEELPHLGCSDIALMGYRRGADDIHIIRNVGADLAMSIHVYCYGQK